MNFKKLAALLLALVLCVGALAACGDKTEDSDTQDPSSQSQDVDNQDGAANTDGDSANTDGAEGDDAPEGEGEAANS